MKKILAWSMAVLMAAGSLTGCGGSGQETATAAPQAESAAGGETSGETSGGGSGASEAAGDEVLSGELTVMLNNAFTALEDPAVLKAADAFEELHPGVTITIEGLSGSELISKFTTSAMAGSGPDVVALDNSGWPIDLAAMGLILPLDERIEASENDYLQGPLESGMYEGNYYSVP